MPWGCTKVTFDSHKGFRLTVLLISQLALYLLEYLDILKRSFYMRTLCTPNSREISSIWLHWTNFKYSQHIWTWTEMCSIPQIHCLVPNGKTRVLCWFLINEIETRKPWKRFEVSKVLESVPKFSSDQSKFLLKFPSHEQKPVTDWKFW